MRKPFVVWILALFSLSSLWAQKPSHFIYGGVFDVETEQVVDSVWVELLSSEGKVLERMLALQRQVVGRGKATWKFSCDQQTAEQVLRFCCRGYEQKEVVVPAFKFHKGERGKRLFDVYLRPIGEQTLHEATVVAHKISFFHKGDTLVFNMHALEIGDGSMLDVLVRQTPSMELNKDGRIFSNGRMIESVLLNGEDFFGVDGGVLLNHLPAYMVKRLHIYEKQSQFSEYVGKDVEKREFVMDVELKERYNEGWTGQVLAGVGTDQRYLSRFMALYFSPQMRLSFYGNANNLNVLRQPGEDDGWTPEDLGDQLVTTQLGGVDVLLSDTSGRYTFASHSEVEHQLRDKDLEDNAVDFLPTGDAYRHSWTGNHVNAIDFSTSNSLEVHPDGRTWYNAALELKYVTDKERGNLTDATFSEKIKENTAYHLRDSLRLRTLPELLRRVTLNRNEELGKSSHHLFTGMTEMSFQRKFRDKDLLNLAGTYLYAQEKGKNFDISLAEFPGSAEAEKEYLYRYGHQIPHRTSQLNLTAAYFHWWKEDWVLTPKYTVDIVAGKGNFQLYDLHRLPGFSWEHAPSLGTLPLEELTDVRNDQNSYHQRAVDGTHTLDWTLKWQKGRWFVQLNTPVRYVHRKMTYRRGEFDDTFVRRYCFFEPAVDAYYRWGKSVERKLEFTYAWQHDLPEMTDFVEEVNDLHPLEHYLGNTFLKSGTSHALALSFQRNRKDVNCSFGTTFETLFCPRGLGELTCFDYQKGVTSYKKYNTYGTYWLGNTTAFSSPLGNKYSPWRLKNESTVQYVHGTDYTQENRETAVERDVVHTLWLADNLSLHFHRADWRTFVTVGGEWNRASSGRPNFTSINVGSLHYGLSLTTPRFWGIQLSTDLTKYNRYGYEFSSKKKELVWNVRVSRDFGKNLLVYFDGFDLLHRLSGIYHSISAQGRVETVCHTIPRYAMLHVVYKFYHSTK